MFRIDVAALGDLDVDGVGDLAVGARLDDGGASSGAGWVRFLDSGTSCDLRDANCDGSVDLGDVEPFINMILAGEPCDAGTGDTNSDGSVDPADIEGFIDCLPG